MQVLEPDELTEPKILEKLRGTRVERVDSPAVTKRPSGSSSSATESKLAESKPVESKPVESKPVESKPSPSQSAPAQKPNLSKAASKEGLGNANVNTDTMVTFADESAVNGGLEEVRKDSAETNWIMFGHAKEGSQQIVVLGKGGNGLEGMDEFFTDDAVVYGVLGQRVQDTAQGADYSTTKYVFISWVGPKVKPLAKARSSQTRVALYNHSKKFMQLAGEVQALEKSDVSLENVIAKLKTNF